MASQDLSETQLVPNTEQAWIYHFKISKNPHTRGFSYLKIFCSKRFNFYLKTNYLSTIYHN